MTIVPHPKLLADYEIIGRAAHVTAASPNGPRYDPSLTAAERKSADNGIWLCAGCADLIDKQQGRDFSSAQIRSWKQQAESEVRSAALLHGLHREPRWIERIGSPHYINIPRVVMMGGAVQLTGDTSRRLKDGFPQDGYIVSELVEARNLLRYAAIEAVDVDQIIRPDLQLQAGLVISFYQNCRTRNGKEKDTRYVESYNFEKSPLIYFTRHGCRYVMPYDPRWITTSTARSDVRTGQVRLAGIAIVKRVTALGDEAVCSPLTFGIPDLYGIFRT